LAGLASVATAQDVTPDDEYLWLEDIESDRALDWVRRQNRPTLERFESNPLYPEFKATAEKILQDKERIPYGRIRNGYVDNFWRDEDHVRGIWRRTKLEDYLEDDVPWETVLDVDALARAEEENWVFKGAAALPPEYTRRLVSLSRGGKDAHVVREFDLPTRRFVPDGFRLEEAKSRVSWYDRDTLVVGTDFGEGSLTRSGYPRVLKVWRRGQPLEEAKTIFEGEADDMIVGFSRDFRSHVPWCVFERRVDFYHGFYWLSRGLDDRAKIPVPDDAELCGLFADRLLFLLRSDWKVARVTANNALPTAGPKGAVVPQGSLVALGAEEIMDAGRRAPSVEVLYVPDGRSSLAGVSTTEDAVLINVLQSVRGKVLRLTLAEASDEASWRSEELPLPDNGSVQVISANEFTDKVFLSYESFLVPERLYLAGGDAPPKVVKTLAEKFDAGKLVVDQHHAKSTDGTRIPYFVVRRKGLPRNGTNPTLLSGYGGFEIPELPSYMPVAGNLWLERGGVYVVANIRGGGEFGPRWHQAALKENRQKAFDDFLAVAEDLIAKKITSPRHLGIMGGSNGGLLVGACFTQRPELFRAVVCLVPLLDMLRYTQLLAGASWMAEYGDPDDPKMRPVIARYSPYQNVKPDVDYPEVFFLTSTKDDRVHPGHARKMVARMTGMGHKVFYYENIEGGHGAAANLLQRARREALAYVYLHEKLFPPER
jgi:prolyl oligopeptidase